MCECSKVSQERAGYISIVNHPSAGVSGSAVRGHALRGWWCGRTYSSFLFICSLHSGSGLVPQTCRVTNLTKTTIETISHRARRDRDHGLWSTLFEIIWKHDGEKSICVVIQPIYRHKPMWFFSFFMALKSSFHVLTIALYFKSMSFTLYKNCLTSCHHLDFTGLLLPWNQEQSSISSFSCVFNADWSTFLVFSFRNC